MASCRWSNSTYQSSDKQAGGHEGLMVMVWCTLLTCGFWLAATLLRRMWAHLLASVMTLILWLTRQGSGSVCIAGQLINYITKYWACFLQDMIYHCVCVVSVIRQLLSGTHVLTLLFLHSKVLSLCLKPDPFTWLITADSNNMTWRAYIMLYGIIVG